MSPRSSLLRSDRLTASLQSLSTGTLAFGLVASLAATSASAETLMTFGSNQYGAAGVGTEDPFVFVPTQVVGMVDASAAAAGGAHALGVASNGQLYGWGLAAYGGTGTDSGGALSLPVTASATLPSGVTDVAAGLYHAWAIADGALYGFGFNVQGVVGQEASTQLVPVPTMVAGMESGVTAISTGQQFGLVIQNGGLYGLGDGNAGGFGNGGSGDGYDSHTPMAIPGMASGVTSISVGQYHATAIKDGEVYAWAYNSFAQAGVSSDTLAVTEPTMLSGLTGATQVVAGSEHSMALLDGTVYTWGRNNLGQLGVGEGADVWDFGLESPQEVDIDAEIVSIAAGSNASYALDADGNLWVWGNNTYGQLGLGDTDGLAGDEIEAFYTPQMLTLPEGISVSFIASGSMANGAVIGVTGLPVPEPTTGLAVAGLGGLVLGRRRRRQA